MIYFDNAATTMPKPPAVAQAMADAIATCGNASRGAHGASLDALRVLERTRGSVAALFNLGNPARVAFTPNATYALNVAIHGVKGHIVSTHAEHNSVLRPLHRRGNYTLVPLDDKGGLNVDDIARACRHDTEAIIMTHASNVTGAVFDLAAAGEVCRRKNIRFIVDAAQTAGVLPLDMQARGIAALCFSGHKSLYGPQGTGGICFAADFSPTPLAVGGTGSESFSLDQPGALPDAVEAGTQNAHSIAGLEVGMEYVRGMNGRGYTKADRVARHFVQAVRALPEYILYGDVDAPERTPVVALNHRRLDSAELATRLYENYGIAVRAGAHCAPLMHRTFGQIGAVRFSFSHFNTEQEINFAVEVLKANGEKKAGLFF